jgi:hypothetical protein
MHRRVPRRLLAGAAATLAALSVAFAGVHSASAATPLSGAIFTTLPDGSEVNFNIYQSKDDVYLVVHPASSGH